MLGDLMNSWKAFSASCWLWKCFPCKKMLRCLKEVVVHWREIGWIWQMRQNFGAQFIQLLKCWLCDMWSGIVEKNWVFSVDQCQLLEMQFSVHLTDLLSILLRYNGFTGIQKPTVDQTGSRPVNNDMTFFLVQVWVWEVLWSFFLIQWLSWLLLIVAVV